MGRRRQKAKGIGQIIRDYLIYYQNTRQSNRRQIMSRARILEAFGGYLEKAHIQLQDLNIEHVDSFLAGCNASYARSTQRLYRSYLRCFLRYLYLERNLLTRDLSSLVVGPPMFAKAKPPKFLRSDEVQRLLENLPYLTGRELRTYAMVHLALFMGLRPCEISRISLDDICFVKGQMTLQHRKNARPLQLPIPDNTLKAIVAYIVGARPEIEHRMLFVALNRPYRPITSAMAGRYVTDALRSADIRGSAYWLRHTYAQNLLEAGARIFEIKEMLGHDSIESTGKYLSIHTSLMRKVLFDETV